MMQIFLSAALINNFVLSMFLGICPTIGVSGKIGTAWRMGVAVTFTLLIASLCAFGINKLLTMIDAPYLTLTSYIVVIAATVQLIEMILKKFSPALFRAMGIFLPLITTNCCVLAVALFQTSRGYTLLEGLVFALGVGAGFTLALALVSGLREELDLADVPKVVKGTAVAMMVLGILSLAFMGFAGMGN